jgi:ornithine carbamoyltransferase
VTITIQSTRHLGSLLSVLDLDKAHFLALLDRAAELNRAKATRTEHQHLTGRNIALVFEKNSTRTRCAFEVTAYDQGAHVTFLGPEGSHIGREESIPDTARVLGRMFDGIEFRGFDQTTVEQLADHSGVPVWNGLTDQWHPTQKLADVLTMHEHHPGPIEEIACTFLGDRRGNIARSLLVTAALLGMDLRIGAPKALWPPADVIRTAHELADASGASILVTDHPADAISGVDFVYTDVWVSMGESAQVWADRIPQLVPYRVTERLMAVSGKPGTKFLHCLPAIHDRSTQVGRGLYEQFDLDGVEVTDAVFESPRSIVFDQAENRLHTIKAVLVEALGR